jgi:hypothetical protein
MFLFKLIGSLVSLVAGAVAGNWAGTRLQAYLTGEEPEGASFVHTNEAGETVIAVEVVRSQLLPALFFGLLGKPRWLFAFVGGLLSSGLLDVLGRSRSEGRW